MNFLYLSAQTSAAVETARDFYYTPFASVSESLAYGLPFSLFGFAVVFAILALLWGILSLFKFFFYTIPEKKKNNKQNIKFPVKTEEKASLSAPAAVTVPEQVQPPVNECELVAVISAAIATYRSIAGESVGGFRVVSFKRRK